MPGCGWGDTVGDVVGVGEVDFGCLQSCTIFKLLLLKLCRADSFLTFPLFVLGLTRKELLSFKQDSETRLEEELMLTDWTISVGKTRLVGLVTEFLISSKSAAAPVGGPVLPFSTMGFLSTFGDNAGDDCLEDTVLNGGGGGIDGEDRL